MPKNKNIDKKNVTANTFIGLIVIKISASALNPMEPIRNAGWHFAWLGGPEAIKTKSSLQEIVESGNIFNSLPKKEIDFTIRLRTPSLDSNNSVRLNRAWLFLYRR